MDEEIVEGEQVIWTDQEILTRVLAHILEDDAKNGGKRYPAVWTYYAMGGSGKGWREALRVDEIQTYTGENTNIRVMLLASARCIPLRVMEKFDNPALFAQVVSNYQEVLEIPEKERIDWLKSVKEYEESGEQQKKNIDEMRILRP